MKDLPVSLILSLSATGVAVARSLASHNVTVYGTDHQFGPGMFSKYIKEPNFGKKVVLDDNFLKNLIDFSKAQNLKPVLFPSDDKFIEFVSRHYHVLRDYFVMQKSLSPDECKLFLDKKEFYEVCEKNNIRYAKTIFLNGIDSCEEIVEQLRFPLILKPHLIHKWKRQLHGAKVIFIKDPQSLKEIFIKWKENLRYMVIQEVIEGEETDLWIFKGYFDENSNVLDYFTGKKIRQYPPMFGSASLAVSMPNDEIAKISIDFLKKIKFRGLCGTEFKYDRRDNEYKMIEVNIRPQLWDDLMRMAGKEIIWMAYCDLVGKEYPTSTSQINGRKWVYLSRDIFSAFSQFRKGKLSLSGWIKSYTDVYGDSLLAKNDPKMFIGTFAHLFYQFYDFYLSSKRHLKG